MSMNSLALYLYDILYIIDEYFIDKQNYPIDIEHFKKIVKEEGYKSASF